jgi:hypothetical protein
MTANKSLLALAVTVALGISSQAYATLSKAATFDDKVSNSAAIILGHRMKSETRWDAQHRFILTYTTFKIEKSYKGLDGQQEITVVTPGGTVGGISQETVGVPDFPDGKDHVIFIRNTSVGPTITFFDQGTYDVITSGSERLVRPVETDAVNIDTQRGMAVAPEEPRTLSQFESAVRESERRTAFNRMQVIKQQQKTPASFTSTLARYKYLVLLALIGVAIATWQLIRR